MSKGKSECLALLRAKHIEKGRSPKSMEGFDSQMHSSDIDFKVHEEIKVGEIIAKFDISGRDRSWQDYRQIRCFWPNSADLYIRIYKLARTPNIEYGTSDKGQTVPPSNRESHSLKVCNRFT
jgi:hypothetical protein